MHWLGHPLEPKIMKCTLCHPRLLEGKLPGCVEACPHDVLAFGSREELLELNAGVDWHPAEIGAGRMLFNFPPQLTYQNIYAAITRRPIPSVNRIQYFIPRHHSVSPLYKGGEELEFAICQRYGLTIRGG